MKDFPSIGFYSEESFVDIASDVLKNTNQQYLLISLSLDNFRNVTLSYGYQTYNVLLHDLAVFFQSLAQSYFLSCRRNSDCFLFLLDISESELPQLTLHLEKQYYDFIEYARAQYPLSRISYHAGIFEITSDKRDLSEAIFKADIAEESIHASQKHIIVFDESMIKKQSAEQDILALFDYMAEEKRILLYLQPKFNLHTKQLTGAEVLVRMKDKSGAIIEPSVFIPVFEKHGLMYQLDLMVLEKTLKLLSQWIEDGLNPVPLSVNFSRSDFYSPEFIKIVHEMLEQYQIPKKYLEFEMTETCFKNEFELVAEHINMLHAQGYTFSIDNFGRSDTSLINMGILPVDIIKLDCNLIRHNIRNAKGRSIISKLIEMFSEIGIETICEGIETEEEALLLKKCGCNYVQGYLFDKPLPVDFFYKKYIEYRNNGMLIC